MAGVSAPFPKIEPRWDDLHPEWTGSPIKRKEDPRLLRGRGKYVDDVRLSGALHAAVLRSPHAHARILRVDVSKAAALPGVYAVLTGQDVVGMTNHIRGLIPTPVEIRDYCIAYDKVRYVGEPVAAVAARTRAVAEDAIELIEVDYEPLPPVVDPEAAIQPGSPLLYADLGTNVVWHDVLTFGDVEGAFAQADRIVKERFTVHRYASTPIETFAATAAYDAGTDSYTVWTNDGRPGFIMQTVADSLRISEAQLRIIIGDIGGGFGNKRRPAYIIIPCLLSKLAGRPVRYLEDRIESLTALMHTCNGHMDVELAVKNDGTFLGIRIRDIADEGKNLISPTQHQLIKLGSMVNCYRIPAVQYEPYSVLTTKCPSGANRGIGKPFMCFAIERIADLAAEQLGMDRAAIRLKNYIQPDEHPYETPTGALIDSGNYPAVLEKTLALIGYEEFSRLQAEARARGRYLGIGLVNAVEPATTNLAAYFIITGQQSSSGAGEAARVRVEIDGSIRVAIGDVGSGQGYETALAQVVGDVFGVTPDKVWVAPEFDTNASPWFYFSGNYANKFSTTDISAVLGAAARVKRKIAQIAAHLFEAEPDDIEVRNGRAFVRGSVERGKTLREIAIVANRNLLMLPPGLEPGLDEREYFSNPVANTVSEGKRVRGQLIFASAAHAAVVEVDVETGMVEVKRYVVVHDCGRMINPRLVDGQVHGATVHGIGAALLEEFVYDGDGQLLTTTFMDYLKPTSAESPNIVTGHVETPSPFTPLGTKGAGEGGAIPAPACLAAAVEDALRPFGVRITALPLSPERVLRLIEEGGPAGVTGAG